MKIIVDPFFIKTTILKYKFFATLIFFLAVGSLLGQEQDQLKLEILEFDYSPHQIKYVSIFADTITENRVIDSIYTRLDYYETGNLRAKYKVLVQEKVVTKSSFDSIKRFKTVETFKSIIDQPFGEVEIYHDAFYILKSKSPLKTSAQIKNNKIIGIFLRYPMVEDILIRANFNEKNELEGKYEEYFNFEGNYSKLKCTGQFGEILKTSKVFNPDLYLYSFQKTSTRGKVGEWIYYNELGEIEGKVIYDWRQ